MIYTCKVTEAVDNFVGKSVYRRLQTAPERACNKTLKF